MARRAGVITVDFEARTTKLQSEADQASAKLGKLGKDGQAVSLVHREDKGLVAISSIRPPNTAGVTGTGSLCTLTFKAIAAGDSSLSLVKVGALNSAQANLPAVGSQAVVHVK